MRFAIRAELRDARLRPSLGRPAARCCLDEEDGGSRERVASWRRGDFLVGVASAGTLGFGFIAID
jgi:hypothetical protein